MGKRRRASDDVASRADFIVWAMGILLALGALWLDPFGFSTHAAQLSDQVLNRVFGDQLLGRESADSSHVTVVLVRDDDARLIGPSFTLEAGAAPSPILPIAFHARLLERLLAYEPAAVFLDYRFLLDRSNERRGLDEIEKVAKLYAPTNCKRDASKCAPGIPLFVVVAPHVLPPDGINLNVANALAALPRDAYVIADQDLRPDARHLYQLAQRSSAGAGQVFVWSSPALAIYQALCTPDNTYKRPPALLDKDLPFSSQLCKGNRSRFTDRAQAVQLIWGSSIASPQSKWSSCGEPGHWFAVLWHTAFGDAWETRLNCGHQPTLLAADILTSSESWQKAPCTTPSDEDSLAPWLCGRVVMIGPLSHTQPDFVLPPTSKPLPGVYWHAMALDNLLLFNDDYKRDVYQLVAGLSLPNTLLALLVFLLMGGVAYALGHLKQLIKSRIRRRCIWLHISCSLVVSFVFVFVHFSLAFAVGWSAFAHMNLAPVNWLGIFVTGVALPPAVLALSRSSQVHQYRRQST